MRVFPCDWPYMYMYEKGEGRGFLPMIGHTYMYEKGEGGVILPVMGGV